MEEHNNEAAGAPGAGLQESPSAISADRDPCGGGADASARPPAQHHAGGEHDDRPLFPLESLFWCQPISSDDRGAPDYYNDSNDRR